jgi:UDP-N-acetyl-D-glucosamine dehydrogenase
LVEKIAVIGQGYVGLPLAITAAEAGFFVVGIDIDSEKVNLLSKGVSTVEDVSNERLLVQLQSKNYTVSTEFDVISGVEIILICVPTPLDSNQKPDLSYVKNSVEQIADYLKPDSLVILESTVEPGTTRNMIQPSLEKTSSLSPNTFHLAFSPERIDPTNKKWNLATTPKIVAGMTTAATKRAVNFYSKFK